MAVRSAHKLNHQEGGGQHQKAAENFENPVFPLGDMLVSIRCSEQFDNPALSAELVVKWWLE